MKAIVQDRYGDLDVLELRDIDQPVPRDNEVLVRVHAAGLDRGVVHVMTGLPYMIRLVVPTLARAAQTQGPRPGHGPRRARRGRRQQRDPVPAG
jgi:NADPH:quinone reductase-like Zn-dependent oxidoreductase